MNDSSPSLSAYADPTVIRHVLTTSHSIAVVGLSPRPDRPSHQVATYLKAHGYRVIPVNPQITGEHVHGEFVFRDLSQIEPVDMVDIFRRPQAAGEAVDEAIAAGAKAVWMQLGVINEEAAARAEATSCRLASTRCCRAGSPTWPRSQARSSNCHVLSSGANTCRPSDEFRRR